MQGYYKKVAEDIREEMVGIKWKRMDWHRLLRSGTAEDSKDNDDDGSAADEREDDSDSDD